jgi:alpha-galactosidase/6-phospho-beta-glucosidase family protein
MIAMPLGIALILYHVLDMRKKFKINDSGWNHKTFINSYNLKDGYEQRYY